MISPSGGFRGILMPRSLPGGRALPKLTITRHRVMCRAAPVAPRRGESTMSVSDVMTAPGLLARERIIAKPGFNRWLVPPAALAIHLCIGMAYGFSVFWLPLSKAVGVQ